MSCVSRGSDGHAFMTGVFDGHAGPHCAQAVAERLFYYTYFANCSNDEIKTMLDKYHKKRPLPLFGIRYFLSIGIADTGEKWLILGVIHAELSTSLMEKLFTA